MSERHPLHALDALHQAILGMCRWCELLRDCSRAGADLVQLGVPQQPPGRVFVDVAVPAQNLRQQRHSG